MSSVAFEGIEMRFGDVVALGGLDMTVPDGAFLVLLGPSGCGKTTALRIAAGLELPTAGRVLLGDEDVTHREPRDRDVAMVFQSYALYPHMTVEQNIAYPLRVRGVPADQRAARVRAAAESLDVTHLLDRRPKQLSGGQRQRIALARAIVREPACFLMDEPLSNLDAQLRLSTRGEIKRLQRELGTTTLYVTHDQAEAMTMADLVAVMRHGELQQLAPPAEIYERPATRFVAEFVGSPPMNVIPGAADPDRGAFAGTGWALPLDPDRSAACAAAGADHMGVRPEDLEIVAAGTEGALPGEVYVVEPMGNETIVDALVGEVRIRVRAPRGFQAAIGAPIGLRADPEAVCFFAPDGTTAVQRSRTAHERQAGAV